MISSLLKIHYDPQFITVASRFVESLAAATGIGTESARWLCLLVEESLAFVMDKYIDSRLDAHIELLFQLSEDCVVHLEIMDKGPPIHEDRIPRFDVEDAASISGLWYKLVKDVADDFTFINNQKDGWLIRIARRVDMDRDKRPGLNPECSATTPPSLAEHRIRTATPGDAGELMDLAFLTYRYSYAADFYDRTLLEQAIADGSHEITVLDNGIRIVGAYVVIHPESGEKWAEVGSAMVLPEYRTTRAVMYLFRAMGRYFKENPRGCDFFTSHLVTTHPRSQKLLHKIRPPFIPLFLFPNMVPRPEFIGIDKSRQGRESLLWSYSLVRPLAQRVLHAPGSRQTMIRSLLDNTGCGEAVTLDDATHEPQGATRLAVERVDQQGFALIHLESLGAEWFTAVTKEILALVAARLQSIAVTIPTTTPLPADMEAQLASINLLFSGISLAALDSLRLVYCLTLAPIDFKGIQLHDPVARQLVDAMQAEYETRRHA